MHRRKAGKGIRPPAEIRGNPAVLDRPAFRINLLVELPSKNQVLENTQLLLAAGELGLQIVDHGGEIGICAGWPSPLSAPPSAGGLPKSNSPSSRLAMRVRRLPRASKANHIGIHLPDTHRQGIDLFLQDAPHILDLRLLTAEGRPTSCPAGRWDSHRDDAPQDSCRRKRPRRRCQKPLRRQRPRTRGWCRSTCLTRPLLRPTKMKFIENVVPKPSCERSLQKCWAVASGVDYAE